MHRLSIHAIVALASLVSAVAANADPVPTLATQDQIRAEQRALHIVQDPRVQAVTARIRQELLTDPAARTVEGRATLDHALSLWLHALALREVGADTSRPTVVWEVDDTPHSWFGHTIPGAGGGGVNTDNIYRGTYLDGSSRYELTGNVPEGGPIQFSIETTVGRPGELVFKTAGKASPDMGNQLGLLRDADIKRDARGNFTVTLDSTPAGGRANHIQLPPGPISLLLRNSFSDWRQKPTSFSIKRTDGKPAGPVLTDDIAAKRLSEDLPAWVKVWTTLKAGFLGNPAPNRLAGPLPRDGGWGLMAGGRFSLSEEEALVVTTSDGGAQYTGFQLIDDWYAGADARHHITSRNNGQVTRNADGTVTYVVSLLDPGAPNWLDTAGLHSGFLLLRWQQLPAGLDPSTLIKSVRVVKLSDLPAVLPAGTPRVAAEQRREELKVRSEQYQNRLKL